MPAQGFLPVRQLVLVDLLSLIVGTKPTERAIVAIDGDGSRHQRQLVAELLALAPAVTDRDLVGVSTESFTAPGSAAQTAATGADYYREHYDHAQLHRGLLSPFQQGREVVIDPRNNPHDEPQLIEPSDTAILVVSGPFLHRPELTSLWDASLLVHPAGSGDDTSVASKAWEFYVEQSPAQQARWVVDLSDPQRPHLLVVDPEDPVV
ncbi:hypothetical protein K0651_00855 [Ornithinimicrobium sp. Arc0846-15]|nr:hypothetical protein [Ornithinimicrobium laminariae]